MYPLYRCTPDGRHAYRIEGPREFTEVQLIGKRAVIHRVRQAPYPEQLRIRQILDDNERYKPMEAADFHRLLDQHDGK